MTLNHQQPILSRGWAWAKVDDICDAVNGKAFKPSDWSRKGTPIIRIQNLRDRTAEYNHFSGEYDRRFEVTSGDLLFAWSGTPGTSFGAHIWKGPRAVLNQHIFNIRFDQEAIVPVFLQEALNQNVADYVRQAQGGVGLAHITKTKFMASYVPLPPLPEQHRIVAEIEKQFTRLDAAVAALRRTQANLKRYRASVLRAACSGKLVPTEAELAHAEGREYEPAGVLMERILAERRARWEPQEKRRGKYKEPAAPDTSNLPLLPEGWAWATVDQMIVRSEYGTSVKCGYESDGIPVLRIPNIVGGEIDLTDLKFANQSLPVDDDRALRVGDVLMCRTNGSISLIGKTAVIKRDLEPHHSFASYLLRFRFVDCPPLSKWFHLFATSRLGRNYIEREAASSAGQHNVSLSLIHRMAVPLPPLAEQRRIVAEVEQRLSVIQQAESAVEASLQRAERLRQSILKRAFSGELVPQDPDDEPASVLLERIRAQREAEHMAASAAKKRPARRRRTKPQTEQLTLEEASA